MKLKNKFSKKYYFEGYDNLTRFISYFYQINLVQKLKPTKVLEIGVGNKTTSNYLKESGIKIDTCDFDEGLNPNYVADIRKLPFKDKSYDVVMSYEVLEHLPWEELDTALNQLHRVSKKYVIISIPYFSGGFEFIFKFPLIGRIIKKQIIDLFFRIPYFFLKMKPGGGHYWEMGRKNYPIKKIRNALKNYFKIVKEVRPLLNNYHYFFVLKKKELNSKK